MANNLNINLLPANLQSTKTRVPVLVMLFLFGVALVFAVADIIDASNLGHSRKALVTAQNQLSHVIAKEATVKAQLPTVAATVNGSQGNQVNLQNEVNTLSHLTKGISVTHINYMSTTGFIVTGTAVSLPVLAAYEDAVSQIRGVLSADVQETASASGHTYDFSLKIGLGSNGGR